MVDTRLPRLSLVDATRGLAILGVALFHLVWDLRFLGFTSYNAFWDPLWLDFAKLLVSTFLTLVGVSLVLAHPTHIRWRAFRRRFGVLVLAALGVSVATFILFQDGFVYFGVLHAIALFSLAGLLFLRLPVWAVIVAACLFLFAHFFYQSTDFNVRTLSWIGFWTEHPYTQDLVPIFPGFGFTLAGIAGTRIILALNGAEHIARIDFKGFWYRALIWCGRWSLIIYLVHQPLLLAFLYPADYLVHSQEAEVPQVSFFSQCVTTCEAGNNGRNYCESYCGCALDMVERAGLWDAINAPDPTVDQQSSRDSVIELCTATAGDPADYE